MKKLHLEKRYVSTDEVFMHMYISEKGIFISGWGGPNKPEVIEEKIRGLQKSIEDDLDKIAYLKQAIAFYKQEFQQHEKN